MNRNRKRIKDEEQPVQFTPNVLVFLTRGGKREGHERRAQEEGGWRGWFMDC